MYISLTRDGDINTVLSLGLIFVSLTKGCDIMVLLCSGFDVCVLDQGR